MSRRTLRGGGSTGTSLASQTGQAGKYLKTDGTNASWSPAVSTVNGQVGDVTVSIALYPWEFDVTAYGAKVDGLGATDAAMTASSNVLTSASAAFTNADIGKTIQVRGAGAAGAYLTTTISGRTNATTVTLTASASTTVSATDFVYGTNDTAAIQSAVNAAVAYADANASGYACVTTTVPGISLLSSAISGNGQINLPARTLAKKKIAIEFRSPAQGGTLWLAGQSVKQTTGWMLQSTLTGQSAASAGGIPAILASPTGTGPSVNIKGIVTKMGFRTPDNPSLGCVNFLTLAQAVFRENYADTDVTQGLDFTYGGSYAGLMSQPTNPAAIAFITPGRGNNVDLLVEDNEAIGYFAGFSLNEHAVARRNGTYRCWTAYTRVQPQDHQSHIDDASVEWCPYILADWSTSGLIDLVSPAPIRVTGMQIEAALGSNGWVSAATNNQVKDANGVARGPFTYLTIRGNIVAPGTGFTMVDEARSAQMTRLDRALPLLADPFVRADSATSPGTSPTGHAWTANSGTWGITSNKLYVATSGGTYNTVTADAGFADGRYETEFSFGPTRADFLGVFRYTDDNNMLFVEVFKVGATTSLTFFKRISGTNTTVAALSSLIPGLSLSTTHRLRVDLVGNVYSFWFDGAYLASVGATTGQEAATKYGAGLLIGGSNDLAGTGGTLVRSVSFSR